MPQYTSISFFFFFNDTATTEIYTLSLHDALPIYSLFRRTFSLWRVKGLSWRSHCYLSFRRLHLHQRRRTRSEEHTSELQSQSNLVCRLLLEKKKKKYTNYIPLSSRHPMSNLVTSL